MPAPPSFSVIIPTYGRPGPLGACLQAMTKLDYPRDSFEVIVIDDKNETQPETVANPFKDRLNIAVFHQPHLGPAAARNSGTSKAGGSYLAFTDDDCVPASDWLNALSSRFAQTPESAVGGRTINKLHDNLFSTASQALVDYLYAYYNTDPGKAQFLATSNLAVPARHFRSIGGFNTSFPFAGGEDREFCYRWMKHGYSMSYAPEVVVFHRHKLALDSFLRQHIRYGRGAYLFHREVNRYNRRRIQIESLAFYMKLLGGAFLPSQGRGWTLALMLLFGLTQIANVTGFFWERLKSRLK